MIVYIYLKTKNMKGRILISEEEKRRILQMHTSASRKMYLKEETQTVDMSSVNTALNNLNTLLKSIPNRNKQDKKHELNAFEKYFDYGYYLNLIALRDWSPSQKAWMPRGGYFDTDITMTRTYDAGGGKKAYTTSNLLSEGLGIAIFKDNVSAGGYSTEFKSGVYEGGGSKNKIKTSIENLLTCANYVNKKDYSAAVDMINTQIKPALDTLASELESFMEKWPSGLEGKLTLNGSNYEMTFTDPIESKTGSDIPGQQ